MLISTAWSTVDFFKRVFSDSSSFGRYGDMVSFHATVVVLPRVEGRLADAEYSGDLGDRGARG